MYILEAYPSISDCFSTAPLSCLIARDLPRRRTADSELSIGVSRAVISASMRCYLFDQNAGVAGS